MADAHPSTSYYDTKPLKATLERLVDFDRINACETRFSVGAVNVRTGNFCYFDNAEMKIRPRHVMASGALPPAFPAVEADGEFYWDGGLVSNTPLQYVLSYYPRCSRLAFQMDLFPFRTAGKDSRTGIGKRDGNPVFEPHPYGDGRFPSHARHSAQLGDAA